MSLLSEITQYFECKEYKPLDKEKVCHIVSGLRDDLEIGSKKCNLYRYLIEQIDEGQERPRPITSKLKAVDLEGRWTEWVMVHRSVYELLGFAQLLKMDVESSLISLCTATSEIERIVISKHSYTIVAEARNKDLFSSIAACMKKYPDWALTNEEFSALWKQNKELVKSMTSESKSNDIRNSIDAHKASFVEQLESYKTVDWVKCALDMIVIFNIVSNIEICMAGINRRIAEMLEQINAEAREKIAKFEEALIELQNLEA